MMRFKILKENTKFGAWYWTIPLGFFNRLKYMYNPIYLMFQVMGIINESPYSCFLSKKDAIKHIKRWNKGYYKKLYEGEYV